MKKFYLTFLLLIFGLLTQAQNISVADFYYAENDITARTYGTSVEDQNGYQCALIKIRTTEKGLWTFDVGMLGVKKTEMQNEAHAAEIWVYVPFGVTRFTIQHEKFGLLDKWKFPCDIAKGCTYVMELDLRPIPVSLPSLPQQQYLAFQISPVNATLEVDDQLWVVDADGSAQDYVNFGTYTYRVQAPNYHSEVGKVTVNDPNNTKFVKVTLNPNFGWIEVAGTGDLQGANVYIDNALVGKAPCKSEALKSGQHTVRIAKKMYVTYSETVTVKDNETTSLAPTLGADFAEITLKVDADAEIWVNNEKKDTRTWTGRLGSGTYKIECKQANHETSLTSKEITAAMNGQTITLPAPTPFFGSLNVESTPKFCKLYIDGKDMGTTPKSINEILIGQHEIRLTQDGYADYTETVTIAKGERKQVNATLNNDNYCKKGKEYYEKKDYTEALKWFSLAVEQGSAEGQNYLGFFYRQGLGVDQDYSKALKWFRKAADQGFAAGQCNLGDMYQHGLGVDQDYSEAIKWYRKAAEQGYGIGQCDMGYLYRHGLGVDQDYSEAIKWYRKAAEQGFAGGQVNLGSMYDQGLGVTKDCMEALKWYRKAAEQGNAGGQMNLGTKYYSGQCVAQDYSEAVKWFRKAADQGFASGQYWMGRMYEEGKGVSKDLDEAKKWYKLAANQGNEMAKKALSTLQGSKITPEDALLGEFSVSPTQKVYFSKGNLQYQASTNTWRFASEQWDIIGEDNNNISPTYRGWIDLFGWGTGNDPTKSSGSNTDYSSFTDWGNNMGDSWRTLTKGEWEYIFDKRSTSSGIRYAKAQVNGVNGVILLPDNWKSSIYRLKNTNKSDASFNSNNISATKWNNTFSSTGAVFLPTAGYRNFHYGFKISGVGTGGYYWLTSPGDSYYAYYGRFYDNSSGTDYGYRNYGQSVRLVCPAE